jgi:hypothetical protein
MPVSRLYRGKRQRKGKGRKGLDSDDEREHAQAGRQAGSISLSFLAFGKLNIYDG